jgi:single-stranded DNA-binding protein
MSDADENTVTLVGTLHQLAPPSTERAPYRLTVETTRGTYRDRHTVTAWKDAGDVGKLQPGQRVRVEGRLQTRSYEKDGAKRWITEVVARTVSAVGAAPGVPAEWDAAGDDVAF